MHAVVSTTNYLKDSLYLGNVNLRGRENVGVEVGAWKERCDSLLLFWQEHEKNVGGRNGGMSERTWREDLIKERGQRREVV